MATLNDILGTDDANYKSSGTLTKLLQAGIPIEEDDSEFELPARTSANEGGQQKLLFDFNNIDVDE